MAIGSPEDIKRLSAGDLLLIAFDLEGTLIDGELFPELGRRLGYRDELDTLTREAMRGDHPFEEALRKRIDLIRGKSLSLIKSVADSLPFTPGAEETLRFLRGMGATPAIISGGFDVLAARAATQLGIERVYSNHLRVECGRVSGVKPPILDPRAKVDIIRRMAREVGVPLG